MARALWKGTISFGLVSIPASLYTATKRNELAFHMLDKRDFEPVHQERKDAKGHDVGWDDVVKGYEYEKDQWVVLTDADLERANVEATESLDIMHFVDEKAIDPVYYETPYYLEPAKAGRKAYALLREMLRREGKVGIAKVVIRTRQHLAALRVDGDVLVAEILRWPYEIRDASELDVPSSDLDELDVSKQEIDMAAQLVNAMAAKWDPSEYHDTYREDVLRMIDEKVRSGQTHVITEAGPEQRPEQPGQVVDIMALLKRSVEQQGQNPAAEEAGEGEKPARKTASKSADERKKQPAKTAKGA